VADLFEQVTNFFDRQEWNSEILEGRTTLTMRVTMPAGTWDVFVDVRETESQLTIYSVAPFNVPKEKLADMAEFQARINYGLIIGNFEMDWDDGEIRFKTSLDFKNDRLSDTLLGQLFNANLRNMNLFFPGLEAVIDGIKSPLEIMDSF
jgi:hypothetical protein